MYPLRYTVLSSNEIENEITESNYKRLEASFRGSDGQVKRNLIDNLKCEKVPLYNPTNGLIKKALSMSLLVNIKEKKLV